jgi:integrase
MPKRLTDKAVRRLGAPAKGSGDLIVFDSGATGLGLKVTPTGKRVWFLWLKYPGQKYQSARTLGIFPAMKVGAARAKAELWYAQVKQGIDPAEIERQEREKAEAARRAEMLSRQNTFAVYAEAYIAGRTNRRATDDGAEIRRSLIPTLGPKPLHEITPRDCRELMAKLRGRSPFTARAAWGHLTGILKQACFEELIPASPMASLDKKLIFKGAKLGPRQRVLTDEEVFAFWRGAGRLGYPFAPFFRLLLLTGVRLNELAKARWSELNPDMRRLIREAAKTRKAVDWATIPDNIKTWTVPRERFKSDSEHVIPLSDDACAILEALPRFGACDFLFSANGKTAMWVNDKHKKKVDRRMLRTLRAMARRRGDDPKHVKLEGWINHDLRRNFRSGLAALDIPDDVAELALGHAKQGLQRIYNQHRYEPQIRAAMIKWATRLRTIVEPAPVTSPDNVVSLRAAG